MRIVIPSYNRPDTITTSDLLSRHGMTSYTVLLHNLDQANAYRRYGRVDANHIMVTNVPLGLSYQRQWAEDNLVGDGEWYCAMDDNLTGFVGLPPPWYFDECVAVKQDPKLWQERFEQPVSLPWWADAVVSECIARAERIGANLVGFANNSNAFFRVRKWTTASFVVGKCFLRRKTGIPWDHRFQAHEDIDQTLTHLQRDGKVLVNNYIFRLGAHYQTGGLGTKTQRAERKSNEIDLLMRKWPEALRRKVKTGFQDVSMKLRPGHVGKWRDAQAQCQFSFATMRDA